MGSLPCAWTHDMRVSEGIFCILVKTFRKWERCKIRVILRMQCVILWIGYIAYLKVRSPDCGMKLDICPRPLVLRPHTFAKKWLLQSVHQHGTEPRICTILTQGRVIHYWHVMWGELVTRFPQYTSIIMLTNWSGSLGTIPDPVIRKHRTAKFGAIWFVNFSQILVLRHVFFIWMVSKSIDHGKKWSSSTQGKKVTSKVCKN